MSKIFNNFWKDLLTKYFQFKGDFPEFEVSSVVPVIPITPFSRSLIQNSYTTTQTSTPQLTIAQLAARDHYVTSLYLTWSKNAASDLTRIELFQGYGNFPHLADIPLQTLTAESGQVFISFPIPIKIESNQALGLSAPFTAGASRVSLNVYGFTIDNSTNGS